MADYYLDNQPGAPFRAELNATLAAIRSSNANSTAPAAVSGLTWFETDTNTLWLRNSTNGAWAKIYTTDKKPTKAEIGLSNVPNYSATGSLSDGSASKFATAAATKALQDNKLDKTATAPNASKLNNQPASYYATANHSHTPASLGAAAAKHTHGEADLPNASTTAQGVVQLSNSTGGSSQTKAATELAVKNAKSEAIAAGVPAGFIGMFAGTEAQIPSGWQLCNGSGKTSNNIQVPDLRARFIVGAGGAYDAGATGGSVSATTNPAGAHSHSVSVGNTTLSLSQSPNHNHHAPERVNYDAEPAGMYVYGISTGENSNQIYSRSGTAASNRHGNTSSTGGSGSHNHSASCGSAGNHSHTVSTMPPYYALCFIIKL